MTAVMSFLRQLAGLFIDDGWLALAILGVVAAAALVASRQPIEAGAILLFGCLGVLFANVRAAPRRRPS
ncbi:MAG: hypothetical protein ABI150_15715 [Nitrobacter sp.]